MKPNQRRLVGLAVAIGVVLSLFGLAMTAPEHPVAVIRVQDAAGDVLDWLLNASLQAALLVPVILLAQWLLRHRLSARWRFALWWLLILRLLLPVSFASPLSIFNYVQPQVNLAGLQLSPPAASEEVTVAPNVVGEAAAAGSADMDSPPIAVSLPTGVPQAVQPVEPSPATPLVANESAETLKPAPGAREFDAGDHLIPLIWTAWFLIALALIGVVTFQSIAFARRLRAARQHTPALLNDLLAECRQLMGIRRDVSLLETEAVTSPVLYGLFRHRILLPWGFANRFSPVELRHVLLHELAHVKRGDLWLNWLVTALQIVHWFNPLMWLGFARLRADRELACDELALLRSGADTGRDYGRTMLKLLEDFARPKAMPGLVGILEDKQQMQRRVRMIARFRRPSRWSALALIPIAALGLVLLTDAQVREETPTEAVPSDSDTAADTVLRVLDDETGDPIAGAVINANHLQLVSDTEGVARIPMTEQMKWMRGVNIFITPVGYVPKVITWPWREEFFREYSVRLQPARTIGGIVVDEAGQPVPGVRVNLTSPDISGQAGIEHIAYHPEQTAAYTDMAGRWEWPYLPRDATNFRFTLTATNYMATEVYAEVIDNLSRKNGIHGMQTIHLTNSDGLTDLKATIYRGFSLTGRVLGRGADRQLHPVAGALVREVHNHGYRHYRVQAITDDRGEFAMQGLRFKPTTLVAEAEGFSPAAAEVELHIGPNKHDFWLSKGPALKGRVLDSNGLPITNALIRTDVGSQGIRLFNWTTRSDGDGRFEWTHAPYGEVLYWFEADGFLPVRDRPLTADDKEHEIILEPRDPPPNASVRKPIFEMRLVESEAGDDTEALPVLTQAGEEAPANLQNLFVSKEALLDVSALFSAQFGTDHFTGRPVINLEFTAEGQARFAEVTRAHVGRQLAFVVDGQVLSAPHINEPITGGKAQISGSFTQEEAERLARSIDDHITWKPAVIVPAASSTQAPARFLEIITEIEFENWDKYHPQSDPLAHIERHRTRSVIGTNSWMIESDYNGRFTRWFTGTRIIARGDAITGYETGDASPAGRAGVDGLMGFDLPAAVTWQAFGSGPAHRQGGAKLYPPGPLWEQARLSPAAWSESTDLFNDNLGLPKAINIFTTDGHLIYQYEVFNSTNVLGWSVPTGFRGMAYRQRPGRRPAMHLLFAARVTAISPVNELGIPEQGGQPNAPVASTQPSSATNLFNFGLVTPAQALDVYRELTGRELIVSTQVTNVAAFVGAKYAQGSREELAEEIKALLLEQAGLVITELDGNRASVTHNEALSVKPLDDPTGRHPPPLGPDGRDVIKPDARPRPPPRNDPRIVESSAPTASVRKPIFEMRLVEAAASEDTETLPNPVETAKPLPERLQNLFVRKEPLLDVSTLFSAKVETDLITGRPIIGIEFTAQGQARFAEVTRAHVGRQLAIVVDGQVLSAPHINEPITGGKAQISGSFTREEAERLARLISDHIARKSAGITPFTGTIQGRVILGGKPPPERAITGMDPHSRAQHTNTPATQFYVVASDGGLRDVVVYLEGDLPPPASAADLPPLVIDHERGFKVPYVSAMAVGQTLLLTNSDSQLHNSHIVPPQGSANREVNKALMHGVASPHTFTAPDHWVRLKCDVHPWEFAYVCVFPHRYFAVTDAGGRFTITNVPPGRYQLHALHRKAKGLGAVEVEISSPAVSTLGLHLYPETALQLVCHPDQTHYAVGDEITLRCTIANISDQEQRVTWHPTTGSHLTLGKDERSWWRDGREAPHFQPVEVRPPVRIESKPGTPLSEIILPPRTSVELVHQRTANLPGSFRWILAYEAFQPAIITSETLELLERETIFSNSFTYEVTEGVEKEGQASQPRANHSVEKP